ncbi:MAG: 4Fe-4S binding protein [Clostridiales Family XIII bacterium]|jgi:adenylylsulfate reductase subunit B|nr:4Fe-4S binding protein [Clostridiales Family XIII bacterium]
MSIIVQREKCIGCGKCETVCPGSLITIVDGAAGLITPEDCWGCASCIKECPMGALKLYMAEDMGGQGGSMWTEQDGYKLHWHITAPDGNVKKITVDSRDSNKY